MADLGQKVYDDGSDKLNPGAELRAREDSGAAGKEDARVGDSFFNAGADREETGALADAENNPEPIPSLSGGFYNPAKDSRSERGLIRIFGTRRRKIMFMGGSSLLVILFIFVTLLTGSFELIHLRENMLGDGNKLANAVMEHRRAKSFQKIVRKLNAGSLQDKLKNGTGGLRDNMRRQGFNMIFDDEGKLQKISYKSQAGEARTLDFSKGTISNKELSNFFDKGKFGREVSQKLDLAIGGKASSWKGTAARSLYSRLGLNFSNWIDRKSTGKTSREQFADNVRHQEFSETQASDRTGAKTGDDLKDKDKDGKTVSGENVDDFGSVADNASSEAQDLLDHPEKSGLSSLSGDALDNALKSALSGKALASTVLKSLNIAGAEQSACSIQRKLTFIQYMKNLALVTALAKFSYDFLTVADGQKAGVVSSDGIKLMAVYLNTVNPDTGRSALNSGGVLGGIMGQSGQHPSAADLAAYGRGHTNTGTLAKVKSIVDKVPGVNSTGTSTSCKIVGNGFVQLGGVAVGIAATIFSGGTVGGADIAQNLALGVAAGVAGQYATNLLLKSATGMVITGYENGEQAGDALASGWGAARAMDNNANGLRPVAKSAVPKLTAMANEDRQMANADESVFDRYFSASNADSLLSRVAFMLPAKLSFSNALTSIPNLFEDLFHSLGSIFAPHIFAAGDTATDCDNDPQIKALNVQTDDFCNPEVAGSPDLDANETEQILLKNTYTWYSKGSGGSCTVPHTEPAPLIRQSDGAPIAYPDGNPVCGDSTIYMSDDMSDYINTAKCFEGRPDILYAPITSESDFGKIPELGGTQNPCVVSGPVLPDETQSGVGRFDRYTTWYGYLVDQANFLEEANNDFGSSTGPTGYVDISGVAPAPATGVTQ